MISTSTYIVAKVKRNHEIMMLEINPTIGV